MSFLREKLQLIFISSLTLPWLISLWLNYHYHSAIQTFLSGLAVVSASFLISWAAETAEKDVPRSFSLAIVALLAVLPEYAVDGYFAWKAGSVGGDYVHYATANMTGANRLLIGVGWSIIAFLAFIKLRRGEINLDENIRLEVLILLIATLYAFTLPLKGGISPFDAVFFVSLYAFYVYLATRAEREEVEVAGVPAFLCTMRSNLRRASVIVLFTFAATVILMSVEAFAEGLLDTAKLIGLDEFLAVQWIAPLASESPELLVAVYFVRRFRITASINTLVSSKVNQWTLLIGTIAVIYSISAVKIQSLPFDQRQSEEVLLTAAQSLFALSVLLDLRLNWKEALALFFLFFAQFLFPSVEVRYLISAAYIALSIPLIISKRDEIVKCFLFAKKLIS